MLPQMLEKLAIPLHSSRFIDRSMRHVVYYTPTLLVRYMMRIAPLLRPAGWFFFLSTIPPPPTPSWGFVVLRFFRFQRRQFPHTFNDI
jgi:hypothetical protein